MYFLECDIRAFRVNHGVPCYGYSFSLPRAGRFDAARARELEVPLPFWNRLQKGETIEHEGITYTPEMVLGPERKGIKLTYCTDTRPTASLVKNAEHADLLICEGMYGEAEKQARASEYKHMTFREAAKVAKDAQVSELWLTHYSPSLVRPKDALPEAKQIFANTKCGKDGMSVTLEFDKDE
jgi:ribonuclease Z